MLKVLIFYSDKDREFCEEFKKWLKTHKGIVINDWHGIGVGEDTKDVRRQMISSADLVILLYSPDFWDDEEGFPYLEREGLSLPKDIFPIQVRHSNFESTTLNTIKPANDIPLPEKNRDADWKKIWGKFEDVIETDPDSDNKGESALDTILPRPEQYETPRSAVVDPIPDSSAMRPAPEPTPPLHPDSGEVKLPTGRIFLNLILTMVALVLGIFVVAKQPDPNMTANVLAYTALAFSLAIIIFGIAFRALSNKSQQSAFVSLYGSLRTTFMLLLITIGTTAYTVAPSIGNKSTATPTDVASAFTETPEATVPIGEPETTETSTPPTLTEMPTEEATENPEVVPSVRPSLTDSPTRTDTPVPTTVVPTRTPSPTASPTYTPSATPETPTVTPTPFVIVTTPPPCPLQVNGHLMDCEAVTNRQYAVFIAANGYTTSDYWVNATAAAWANAQIPITSQNDTPFFATWYEAAAYCQYLGKSLPTQTEWNAARSSSNFVPQNSGEWLSRADGEPYLQVSLTNGIPAYRETAPDDSFLLVAFRCMSN